MSEFKYWLNDKGKKLVPQGGDPVAGGSDLRYFLSKVWNKEYKTAPAAILNHSPQDTEPCWFSIFANQGLIYFVRWKINNTLGLDDLEREAFLSWDAGL